MSSIGSPAVLRIASNHTHNYYYFETGEILRTCSLLSLTRFKGCTIVILAVKAMFSTTANSKEGSAINVTLTYSRKSIWPPKPEVTMTDKIKIPTANLELEKAVNRRLTVRSILQMVTWLPKADIFLYLRVDYDSEDGNSHSKFGVFDHGELKQKS